MANVGLRCPPTPTSSGSAPQNWLEQARLVGKSANLGKDDRAAEACPGAALGERSADGRLRTDRSGQAQRLASGRAADRVPGARVPDGAGPRFQDRKPERLRPVRPSRARPRLPFLHLQRLPGIGRARGSADRRTTCRGCRRPRVRRDTSNGRGPGHVCTVRRSRRGVGGNEELHPGRAGIRMERRGGWTQAPPLGGER